MGFAVTRWNRPDTTSLLGLTPSLQGISHAGCAEAQAIDHGWVRVVTLSLSPLVYAFYSLTPVVSVGLRVGLILFLF